MNIKVITAPTKLPVTLEQVKSHTRVEIDDDDQDLDQKIRAVVASLDGPDGRLGRAIMTQTLRYSIPASPPRFINLPFPPVQSISSVKYTNSLDVETEISSSDYILKKDKDAGILVLKDTASWPTDLSDNDPFPIKIEFICGYGDNFENVPENLKLGIMMEVADFYMQRENLVIGQSIEQNEFSRRIFDSLIWRHVPSMEGG